MEIFRQEMDASDTACVENAAVSDQFENHAMQFDFNKISQKSHFVTFAQAKTGITTC